MKALILLLILFASCVPSEELKRFVGSSDAGKTDPILWMIINQLQAFQTKLTNLEHKVETKMNKLDDKLETKMNKLSEKDDKLTKRITDIEKNISSTKQYDKLGKQLSDFETKLIANSKKITDLKNDINIIKKGIKDKCTPGWKRFNNHCYMFRYDRLTWKQAKHECENYKAYLVKIETSTENRWISHEITVSARSSHDQIWTGLNDLSREGHFTWVLDHSSVGFSNWNTGEPDDGSRGEDCGSIHTNGRSTWNDAPCAYKTGYICEK
ncbi:low affinity immunoglobulin epsilon Fc receptor-like [Mytilus californianus]|uniref:low affinity immunoglobulin epsilon Fc receptor-like n=1 Tax=Mytilus californianus TaxID=6549 RepID=UPI002247D5C2|nr:low affinity immunoglobulin epsilon Fc receptor-like [Mytilus californianus]XP_052084537.1 low affinity immunoglobulin epsilon Fc receptor-like [Mytilus californianus]